MIDIIEKLKDLEVEVQEPPKHIDADISILMFRELKKRKIKPEELAKEIIERIKDYVKEYQIVGGYLNIKLNWEKVLNEFKIEFEKKNLKVIVEHTSTNPNKALHIGHFRNSVLGDSIQRFLKLLGYNVEVQFYVDDTGSQVADTVLGFLMGFPFNPKDFNEEEVVKRIVGFLKQRNLYKEGIEEKIREIINERKEALKKIYGYEIPEKFDHYCGDFVYVIVNKLYSLVPELEKIKNEIIKKIEEGNNEIAEINRRMVKEVMLNVLETLKKFDIYVDLLNKESDILHFNLWNKTFELLKEKGLIIYVNEGEKKGTWCIDLSKWKDFEKHPDKLKVLVRSDGTTVYLAKDIAYAFWKHGLLDIDFRYSLFCKIDGKEVWETNINGIEKDFGKADISINVIGEEQSYLQKIIENLIRDFTNGKKKYIHYSYGLVMLSKETAKIFGVEEEKEIYRMSGRKGIFINVDNLLEKAYEIAYKMVMERNPDLNEEKIKDLAFKIARSTLCFEMLKYDRKSTIVFDLNKALKIEGGTALYIMYTYARINSLLKKAQRKGELKGIEELNEYEKKVLRSILKFNKIIKEVEESLEINKLAEYLLELCRHFNEFYQNVPIIPELDRKPYRLLIVEIVKEILEKLMDVLKIDKVERI